MSLAKGIETGTNLRMSQVVNEVLPGVPAGVLTGPNLAREVAQGHPAAVRGGAARGGTGHAGAGARAHPDLPHLHGDRRDRLRDRRRHQERHGHRGGHLRRSRTSATTPGPCSITRGLAELGRLGFTLGGKVLTFGGLAGVGDLVATCASPKSRNRTVGFALGEGASLDEIVNGMHMVAEGVKSAGPLVALAWAHGVEMPIAEQVTSIVDGPLLAQAKR